MKQAKNRRSSNPGQFQPGVSGNPSGRSGASRLDGFYNQYTGHGTTDDAGEFTTHYTRPVTEREALDLRRGNWLAKRILELRPADCFRRGYTIRAKDKEQSEAIAAVVEALNINEKLVHAGQTEATVGGSALFPVLDGAIGDLAEPLDLDANPRILAVKAIHMLESRELQPVSWYDDITSPKFRMPSRYRVMALGGTGGVVRATGMIIHESRLAVFPGHRVSIEQQPGQLWGWGDSKLTPVRDVIMNFGLSWGSTAAILRNFGERIIKVTGLTKILASKNGEAALAARMSIADRFRSTLRGQVFEDSDSVETLLSSISGLPDLLIQLAQVVSAAAELPITRLFGMSPAGMNSTGEYDQQMDHEQIANEQAHKYRAPLEWLIRLLMLSADGPTGGEEPDVWSIQWNPLGLPSEKETAEARKLTAETDQIYVDMGAPSESILRSRFGGDTYSAETTIDWKNYDAQMAAREEQAAQMAAMPPPAPPHDGQPQPADTQPAEPPA